MPGGPHHGAGPSPRPARASLGPAGTRHASRGTRRAALVKHPPPAAALHQHSGALRGTAGRVRRGAGTNGQYLKIRPRLGLFVWLCLTGAGRSGRAREPARTGCFHQSKGCRINGGIKNKGEAMDNAIRSTASGVVRALVPVVLAVVMVVVVVVVVVRRYGPAT